MHKVLSECPIAADDKASGQMLELMGTVRDEMMGEMMGGKENGRSRDERRKR